MGSGWIHVGDLEQLALLDTYKEACAKAKALAMSMGCSTQVKKTESGYGVFRRSDKADPVKNGKPAKEASAPGQLVRSPSDKAALDAPKKVTAQLVPAAGRSQAPSPGRRPEASRRSEGRPVDFDRRIRQLSEDLRYAFSHMPKERGAQWAAGSMDLFGRVLARRVGNLVDVTLNVFEFAGREVIDLAGALSRADLKAHVQRRGAQLSDSAGKVSKAARESMTRWWDALRTNPATTGQELLLIGLAFYLGSGGLDGDGGIPDTDISMLGIGAHRSVLTHSILPGAVIETALCSAVEFVRLGYDYLPQQHDPLWDRMHERARLAAEQAAMGVSVGLAFHLAVDSVLQPAAYKDLPFPAPIEVHQGIAGANAAAEGLDANKKTSNTRRGDADSFFKASEAWGKGAALRRADPKTEDKNRVVARIVGGVLIIGSWLLS